MRLHDAPDGRIVDCVISVDDSIPKSDDARQRLDSDRGRFACPGKPIQRLAYDFKFSFDCTPQLPVCLIAAEICAPAPTPDAAAGFENIEEQLLLMALHK
jgi:hypothetical protein